MSSTEAEGGFDNREEGRRVAETDRALEARGDEQDGGRAASSASSRPGSKATSRARWGSGRRPISSPGPPRPTKGPGGEAPGHSRGSLLQSTPPCRDDRSS